MTIESASPWRTARRRLTAPTFALLLSVCLNIGLASYIAVQALRGESHEHFAPEAMIAQFAAHLPSRDADILWRVYRAHKPQIEAAAATAQRAHVPILSALSQDNVDTDGLRAGFREAQESHERVHGLLVDTVVEALEQISPEGRRELIKLHHSR
jgi:uncharacterized membrane protein